MELKRKPFQGILNIIRFNWHFYASAGMVIVALTLLRDVFPSLQNLTVIGALIIGITVIGSLLVSFYIYDFSDLYRLKWLANCNGDVMLNINAGFDETSGIIQHKFPNISLTVCDFYNPKHHTEISLKRARKVYPPKPETILVTSEHLPFAEDTFDKSLVILCAHEIRNEAERIAFFTELKRVTKGQIFVTEHLRDLNNFMAYNFGFFHFYSRKRWLQAFERANLAVKQEIKTTPFISTFVLEKHGTSG